MTDVKDTEYARKPFADLMDGRAAKPSVFRRAGKSRGVYLQWLDTRIIAAREWGDHNAIEALVEARTAFTDEFYPK